MAYNGEVSPNKGNQQLMGSSSIKEIISQIEFITSVNEYQRIDNFFVDNFTKAKDSKLKNIFVIDGSKFDTSTGLNNEINVSLININQCVINIPKMVSYLKNSFALPQEYNEIKEDITFNALLPLKGLKAKNISDEKDFFRLFFYSILKDNSNRILNWLESQGETITYKETLLDTYISLLSNLTNITSGVISPCPECKKASRSLGIKVFKGKNNEWQHTVNCKCSVNPKICYITDLLQFYEQLSGESSTEALTTQIMLVLERIMLINLIRNLKYNNLNHILENSAFVMDGSLAIYSHASWLSSAICEEIFKLKHEHNLLILGIEKTGAFVEHLKKINHVFQDPPLKKGTLFFLDDSYIKNHIKLYDNDNFYGEKNYFGKKLFYKNHLDKLFVVNLAFEDEGDKFLHFNERNTKEQREKCSRMDDLIMLLENFSSNAYQNALSFISMANEGAALSSSQTGRKLLNDFINEVLQLKKTKTDIPKYDIIKDIKQNITY